VKLKKHDQELTFGSKVGLLQESGHTPGGLERPGVAEAVEEVGTDAGSGSGFGRAARCFAA
jgi:hypothetical protein